MSYFTNIRWALIAVTAIAFGVGSGAALASAKAGTKAAGAPLSVTTPRPGPPGCDHDGDKAGRPGPGGLSAAASYLGVGTSTLLDDLRSGKTLAQVADATSGKSASGLIDALVADAEQHLGSSVDTAQLKARITAMVNGAGPAAGPPPPADAPPPAHI